MNIDEFLEEARQTADVVLYPPAEDADVKALERRYGINLPPAHRELLAKTNGIMAAGGYLRLFGVGAAASIDISWWNDPHLWKFAWDPVILEFLCFGGDAWGFQFAYRFDDLVGEEPDPVVYVLTINTADSGRRPGLPFTAYLERGFLSGARRLADPFERNVRRELGDLEHGDHVVLSPPPLLGGERSVEHAMKMPAVMAMIIDGEVWMEYMRLSQGGTRHDYTIVAMRPYVDERDRPRMRLLADADVRGGQASR